MSLIPSVNIPRGVQPSPISFEPSGYWDGNEGSWSTFTLQIGSYPKQQHVRVLPSTSSNSIWVVLRDGCTPTDPENCPESRGSTFSIASSSTWDDLGLYTLPLEPLHDLPYSGNADFGFDNITLDWPGKGGTSLGHQIIAGLTTKDFYLGYLGLGITPMNVSSYNDQYPTLLHSLRSQNLIPSATYGYTAGANYRSYPSNNQASLTFGGYDLSRLDSTQNVTSIGEDTYRPLLLSLTSITINSNQTSATVLGSAIIIAIDSTISELWLPAPVCDAFESAFSLIYNSTSNSYTLHQDTRAQNLAMNPSVTFTLTSGSPSLPSAINISLPYSAFDQNIQATNLYGNVSGLYFPIRRATNTSQYMLGRTFLQETYLIMDYDRSAFSVFPAVFPDTTVAQNIIPILPPSNSSGAPGSMPTTPPSTPKGKSQPFSLAGIIAIVCVSALAALLVTAVFLFRRHRARRRREAGKKATEEKRNTGELDALESERQAMELDGSDRRRCELPGLEGDDGAIEVESRQWRERRSGAVELGG